MELKKLSSGDFSKLISSDKTRLRILGAKKAFLSYIIRQCFYWSQQMSVLVNCAVVLLTSQSNHQKLI